MKPLKDFRPHTLAQKKLGKHARVSMEENMLLEDGVAPDETHSQDADRHLNVAHQKTRK